jgi:sulfate adenylyltransferase
MNVSDVELLATGVISPLTGFMGEVDYKSVVHDMHLTNGLPWTIPVTLPVDSETAKDIQIGQSVALAECMPDGSTHVMGVLEVAEKYGYDKAVEAEKVYRTTEEKHPGVARLYRQGDVLLGGEIWIFDLPEASKTEFQNCAYPVQTRGCSHRTAGGRR